MKKLSRLQLDLFVTPAGPVALTDAERRMAVTLLQTLLTEDGAGDQQPNDSDRAGGWR